MRAFATGDRVLALEPSTGRRWLLVLDGGHARKVPGLGVVDPGRLAGDAPGTACTLAGKQVVLLCPTQADLHATVRRKAQIITPKDAARILWALGLAPGMRVFEAGIGSGAMTAALAAAVAPGGEVVVQELRQDFADWAGENLERTGVGASVSIRIGDLSDGAADGVEGPFDACVLDLPAPWAALPHVTPLLAPGARVACYCPQVSQMEATVRSLREAGFVAVAASETIERAWEVKERGSRPSFDSLGHTGFLVFARWTGAPWASSTDPFKSAP